MIPRDEILARFRSRTASGQAIVAASIGSGREALLAEAAGFDLLIVDSAARFRSAGRRSLSSMLPFGDASGLVRELSREIIPLVRSIALVAGVAAGDPFRRMPTWLATLKEEGYSGVLNSPTVGIFDGKFRAALEAEGLGYEHEIEMIALASDLGLLAVAFAFDERQAERMAAAGADVLIAHSGHDHTEDKIGAIRAIVDAGKAVDPSITVLVRMDPGSPRDRCDAILASVRGAVGSTIEGAGNY